MARYRQIQVSFWTDSFVLGLTPEDRYFYLYLMTNPKTSACGVYELPKAVMVFETGYNLDTVEKLIARFQVYEKIEYDHVTSEVMLRNWIYHNEPKSDLTRKCVLSELKSLKNKDFANEYLKKAKELGYPLEGACKPHASNGEGYGDGKRNRNKPPRASGDALFDRFWQAYPKKKSKGQARKAWKKLKPTEQLVDLMVSKIEQAKRSAEWRKDDGQFIPYPATWLNAEGWEDELTAHEPTAQLPDFPDE